MMVLVGDYQPDSYTMVMTATNVGGAPGRQMVMKMKVDAKRTGNCDPGETAGRSIDRPNKGEKMMVLKDMVGAGSARACGMQWRQERGAGRGRCRRRSPPACTRSAWR